MKKIFRQLNFYGQIISGYILALFCFLGSYVIFHNSNANLNDANKYEGKIIATQIANNPSTVAGRYKVNSDVFAFQLDGLDKTLAIYNPKQDYSIYKSSLTVGETITVYFKPTHANKLNIDVYQIEKGGKIILGLDSYSSRNKTGALIALVGGFVLTILQTIRVRKLLKPRPLYSK